MLGYQKDQKKLSFSTRIKSVIEKEGKVLLSLEETYFYPEGGGQPADEGTINGKPVHHVFLEEGEVYHQLDAFSGLTIHMPVTCEVSRKTREDHSVQHTAQHVLTAVLKDEFSVDTVSFHLGKVHATIDTAEEVSLDVARQAEDMVNGYIGEDLKVSIYHKDPRGAKALPLRKSLSVEKDIRIVQVGDVDYCGCGGTHVNSLKELQLFKIMQVEKYKGGSRLYYVAGHRALRYLRELEDTISLLKKELLVNVDEMPFRVRQLKEDKETLHKEKEALSASYAKTLVEHCKETIQVVKVAFEDDFIQVLGQEMMKAGKIGAYYREDGRLFLFTGQKASAKALLQDLKMDFRFRGGGGDTMVQGYVEVLEELIPFVSRLYERLLRLEVSARL